MTNRKKLFRSIRRQVWNTYPEAYCRKLKGDDGYKGFLVWPTPRVQPRGFERAAIGLGASPIKAWAEALITISVNQ